MTDAEIVAEVRRRRSTQTPEARVVEKLTEAQIRYYVGRCPKLTRWAFEGWLRGERHLDGDLIEREDEGRDGDDTGRGGR